MSSSTDTTGTPSMTDTPDAASSAQALTCGVCPHACAIREGATGLCGSRGIQDGRVVSLNYGEATALALDPIEKKPFARFMPGSRILSYGSFGCNMACAFCQNADISQVRLCGQPATRFIAPADLVDQAKQLVSAGNVGVALTYNEPLIAPEYLMDVGRLVKEEQLVLALVTNGYATPDVFDGACTVTDAMNIDLKCFTEESYAKLGAPGGLGCVKRNIEAAHDAGIHVEVTTLIVPGVSDSEEDFREEVAWLANLSPDIPLHLSRFFPTFKMSDASPTSIDLMHRFRTIAQEHLHHVYLGNV